jgi:hypothetical protein
VFIPFHYGDDSEDGPPTAANRLTISGWDLVSKQPHFKYAAVALRPVATRTEAATEEPGHELAGARRSERDRDAVPVEAGRD